MREQALSAAPAAELHPVTSVPTDIDTPPVHSSIGTFVDPVESDLDKDHFIERDGIRFAGTHLIVDFWGKMSLDDLELMESAFRRAVDAAGATLLHIHMHHFTPNGGISGVAVLAESHISVHTWPERGYAAFDVFMCGNARPEKAVDVLRSAFKPTRFSVGEHLRGRSE
jgi:S-adenosylmethionine decarboxylase